MSLHCGVCVGELGKGGVSAPTLNRNPGGDEAVCRNASSRAGVRGTYELVIPALP